MSTTSSGFEAIVFDFDGVIVDSMPQHAEAYRVVLEGHEVTPTDHEVFELEGARSEDMIRAFFDRKGVSASDDEIDGLADRKQKVYAELGTPSVYDGATELVQKARGLVDKTAVVTGTRRANLERIIPELLDVFDEVLAEDAYERGKPDPEPYLAAAKRLGVSPASCIVIENAPRGVQSARAAGVGCVIAITTTMDADHLKGAGAHEVCTDHAAAARLLDHLCQDGS